MLFLRMTSAYKSLASAYASTLLQRQGLIDVLSSSSRAAFGAQRASPIVDFHATGPAT